MKTLLLSATYVVGVGELFLAWYFWKTNSGSEIRKVMGFFCTLLGAWVLLSSLTSYREDVWWVGHVLSLIHIAGMLLLTTLLLVVIIFPYRSFHFDNFHKILLFIPAAIFSYASLFTDTVVMSYSVTTTSAGAVTGGALYPAYNIYLLVLYISALCVLGIKQKNIDGPTGKNTRIFFWSILLGGLPGILADVFIPLVSPGTYVNTIIGVLATGVWVGLTSFIAFRRP